MQPSPEVGVSRLPPSLFGLRMVIFTGSQPSESSARDMEEMEEYTIAVKLKNSVCWESEDRTMNGRRKVTVVQDLKYQ